MKNELVKHGLIAFGIAALVYAVSFSWIQNRREVQGPWQVIFMSDPSGSPYLLINQPALHIASQRIAFPEHKIAETNLIKPIIYDRQNTNTPFGEWVFQDPTFLPGTITFNFWGHGVELMPRTMVIDQKEIPWNTETNLVLNGPGKFERRVGKKPFFQ